MEPVADAPHLLVVGGDRTRLDGLAGDLAAVGFTCRVLPIHDSDESSPERADIVLVDVRSWTAEAIAWCRTNRRGNLAESPLVLIVGPEQLRELASQEGLYEDFVEAPYAIGGLAARLQLVLRRVGRPARDTMRAGELVVSPLNYQASARGVPLELTYMEFELLKFLMSQPGRVFTRETLLSRVWGYEYFGGVRTVDVHVRRLRAKLGDDHARLIETVRGVGYRFKEDEPSRRSGPLGPGPSRDEQSLEPLVERGAALP
ncbi:MAG: winged helix-turn-helix domain-containing protein [Actinomycetota bacterium]